MTSRLGRVAIACTMMAVGAATAASAADMRVYKAAPMVAPAFNWSGCYLGAHGGGGWYTSGYVDDDRSGIGAVAGGQLGCNYQISQFVVGIEGEYWWSGLESRSDTSSGGVSFSDAARNRSDWDVALRMGVTFDRALFYGKLGVAAGRFEYNTFDNFGAGTTFSETGSARIYGLLAGVGLEYAFAEQWSAKIEYDYINFGNQVANLVDTSCVGAVCASALTSFSQSNVKQIVKIGLNYHFGGSDVVSARY